MSRKNKTLRAFLHQNENPTIQQVWDHAWKGAQKEFHARSMQDMEAKIELLIEALRATWEVTDFAPGVEQEKIVWVGELLAALEAEKGGEL